MSSSSVKWYVYVPGNKITRHNSFVEIGDDCKKILRRKQKVEVPKIVGTSNLSAHQFNSDWSPKPEMHDRRYKKIYKAVSQGKHIDYFSRGGKFYPRLLKIGNEYYVEGDGNHRVSVAHVLGIKEMTADLIEIVCP